MSESDMIRGFFKEILKPIIVEAIAEAGVQNNGNSDKRYYTREEGGEHLGGGRGTFYRLAKKGKINILKIGGKTLVDADELDAAIENQEVVRYGR